MCEVGYDYDGIFEYVDEDEVFVFVVFCDLCCEFVEFGVDFFFGDEDLCKVVLDFCGVYGLILGDVVVCFGFGL